MVGCHVCLLGSLLAIHVFSRPGYIACSDPVMPFSRNSICFYDFHRSYLNVFYVNARSFIMGSLFVPCKECYKLELFLQRLFELLTVRSVIA